MVISPGHLILNGHTELMVNYKRGLSFILTFVAADREPIDSRGCFTESDEWTFKSNLLPLFSLWKVSNVSSDVTTPKNRCVHQGSVFT